MAKGRLAAKCVDRKGLVYAVHRYDGTDACVRCARGISPRSKLRRATRAAAKRASA